MNINAEISKVVGVERDYEHSLDAMHEAEMTLYQKGLAHDPYGKLGSYIWELGKVTAPDGFLTEAMLVHATAAQRAEAFLKCLGLWKEEPVSEATVEGLR